MAKRKNPLVEALKEGREYEIQVPEDGDLASMRQALKHGQVLTLSPVADWRAVQPGDIVLVKWRGGGYILHLVQEVQGDQFLIINSLGKVNGWAHGRDILGRVTRIVDPPSLPPVPEMLAILQTACQALASQLSGEDTARMFSVLDDLHWYTARFGPERWAQFPRQNKMSFRWHLWHITQEGVRLAGQAAPVVLLPFIDHAKEHIGYVAELSQLFNV
jgi:hypothetical protein